MLNYYDYIKEYKNGLIASNRYDADLFEEFKNDTYKDFTEYVCYSINKEDNYFYFSETLDNSITSILKTSASFRYNEGTNFGSFYNCSGSIVLNGFYTIDNID